MKELDLSKLSCSCRMKNFDYYYDCLIDFYDTRRKVLAERAIPMKRKRKDESVRFHPLVVTERFESIWKDEDELKNYRAELDLRYPEVSQNTESDNSGRIRNLREYCFEPAYFKLFQENPTGLYNLPLHISCLCDLIVELDLIKKKVTLELEDAPQIFSQIHPFDENFVYFLNTYLGQKTFDRPIWRSKHHRRFRDLFKYECKKGKFFRIPVEVERQLWIYRISCYRKWLSSISENEYQPALKGLTKHNEKAHKAPVYVERPMDYFKSIEVVH